MPWLEKDEVLFIHIPRCGGTSMVKHHKVRAKSQRGKNLYHRLGLKFFFYRYQLLENANFPVFTIENLLALIQFTIAGILFYFFRNLPFPYISATTATISFVTSTFIGTAPILMRSNILRNFFMFVMDRIMCKVCEDTNYIIGMNRFGYLQHLTAERCVRYGYASHEDIKLRTCTIVRNPYSRLVSAYEYNKRMCESFEHFVKAFHKICMKTFHEQGKTDSKYIYCHVLPQYAYTHLEGKQFVGTIIKQEHLKRLVATNWENSGVSAEISAALTGIPHTNKRKKKAPWYEYYNQKTMDLALEMYEKDFEIFGYDKSIPNRPDLVPNIRVRARSVSHVNTIEKEAGTLLRMATDAESSPLEKLEEGKISSSEAKKASMHSVKNSHLSMSSVEEASSGNSQGEREQSLEEKKKSASVFIKRSDKSEAKPVSVI